MRVTTLTSIFVALASRSFAAVYSISDTVIGSDFYNAFSFQAIPDPTHGRVEYVDQGTAQANNLTFASSDTFILRADDTNVVPSSATGRQSVRIQTNAQYPTHVVVFDIRHMPQGCATWPAVWETGTTNWPNLGEVDIVEGVNDQTPNHMTLHTSSGCTMPSSTSQTGTTLTTDCDAFVNSNSGCGVAAPTTNSYGPPFNSNGGGWYAMERTNSYIKIWFWPRNGSPPSDVSGGAGSVDTSNWGTPTANFPNTSCDLSSHFGPNAIIINLTLCGDWAGAVYSSQGCPGSCTDYVDNNPGSFSGAYFDFASMRVYQ